MKAPKKSRSDIIGDAYSALMQITAAKKQACAQYDADTRSLRDLLEQLTTSEARAQGELFATDTIVTPELAELIEFPLAKY